jgi:hypothetical protein
MKRGSVLFLKNITADPDSRTQIGANANSALVNAVSITVTLEVRLTSNALTRVAERSSVVLACVWRALSISREASHGLRRSHSAGCAKFGNMAARLGRSLMRAVVIVVLLLLGTEAKADDKSAIVGTWKLVSVVYEDQQTKERTPVLGEHPKGFQIATPEGRWLALVTADGRPVPKTDEDRAQALRTMIAYTGRYRVEDGKIITKVDAAWNEAWVGSEQIRFIRFDGDLLYIESPPMPHPNVNNKVVRVIVTWQRDKP